MEVLLGSINAERILIFLFCRNEGYAREIAHFYSTVLSPIQNQLNKLEFQAAEPLVFHVGSRERFPSLCSRITE